MGRYYTSPNGGGSWWVEDWETPDQAASLQNVQQNYNNTVDTGMGIGNNWLNDFMGSYQPQPQGPAGGPPLAQPGGGGLQPTNTAPAFQSAPVDPRPSQGPGFMPPSQSNGAWSPQATTAKSDLGDTGVAQRGVTNMPVRGPNVTIADSGLPDSTMDPVTGYVGTPGIPNQQFSSVGDYLNYGKNDYGYNSPTGAGRTTPTRTNVAGRYNQFDDGGDDNIDYLFGPPPEIPEENLPENPQMNPNFSPETLSQFNNVLGQGAQNIGNYYNTGNFPTMTAAQLNTGDIPNPQAQQVGSNSALDFLLSGKGFDDPTMVALRANLTDNLAQTGASRIAAGRRAADRVGLGNSGLGMALQEQAGSQNAAELGMGMNQLDIENAVRGLENRRLGGSMELQRGTTNAGMANQMALANAANVFAGMQQNVANTQQASGVNTQNQQEREMNRAGAQSQLTSGTTSDFINQLLGRATGAESGNVQNTINRNLNQAQLNRQRSMFNTGTSENRYGNALNLLNSNATGSNPQGYYTTAAQIGSQFQPNFAPANFSFNASRQLLNPPQR